MKIFICGKIFSGSKNSKKLRDIYNLEMYSLVGKANKISNNLFNTNNHNFINNVYLNMREIDKTIWVKYLLKIQKCKM